MTGGVPYTEEDRFVLVTGLIQGLLPPGIPVDRVIGMLEKIRGILVY